MNEFSLIKKYLAPLAKDFPGSLNLIDDAALIDVPAGKQLVVTKDAISAGVHFIGNEPPALIARKLLRVNLSDLAAKGAVPLCYFIAACLPKTTDKAWVASFAQGLAEDQEQYGIHLAGGDTSRSTGTLSLSLTALGLVEKNTMLKRSTAKAGDDVYVSGTIGEAALGLMMMQNKLTAGQEHWKERYLLPEPRLQLGQKLIGIAHSCMDISDGLVQDLGHICAASSVGATIHQPLLPLPYDIADWQQAISGGDDYELLFTAPKTQRDLIGNLTNQLKLPITRIGEITAGSSVQLMDGNGKETTLAQKGYQHF